MNDKLYFEDFFPLILRITDNTLMLNHGFDRTHAHYIA